MYSSDTPRTLLQSGCRLFGGECLQRNSDTAHFLTQDNAIHFGARYSYSHVIQKHAEGVIGGDYIIKPDELEVVFAELLALEDAGLIAGLDGSIHKIFASTDVGNKLGVIAANGIVGIDFSGPFDFRLHDHLDQRRS